LLLCDFAEVADRKLSVLGGGWVFKAFGSPMAVGAIIEIPWEETDRPHRWTLRLLDADGYDVSLPTIAQPATSSEPQLQPVQVSGQIDLGGLPPDYPEAIPLNLALAVNFGPVALPAGQRFTCALEIDGLPANNGQVSFSTAGPPSASPPAC
jgi:hypothetical protein